MPGALALRVTMEATGAARASCSRDSERRRFVAACASPAAPSTTIERRRPPGARPRLRRCVAVRSRQEPRADQDRAVLGAVRQSRRRRCSIRPRADRLGLSQRPHRPSSAAGPRSGWLILEDIPELSVDYIDLGLELGRAAGSVLDRSALVSAIEESVAAQTRLALARDVHDSIVQFLAGASFRVEAIGAPRGRADRSMRISRSSSGCWSRNRPKSAASSRRFAATASSSSPRRSRTCARWPLRLSQQWSIDCQFDGQSTETRRSRSGSISTSSNCSARRSPTPSATAAPTVSTSSRGRRGSLRLDVHRQWHGLCPANGEFAGGALVAQGAGRSRSRFACRWIPSRAAPTSSISLPSRSRPHDPRSFSPTIIR